MRIKNDTPGTVYWTVVEDGRSLLEAVATVLKEEAYQVDWADNGPDGLYLAQQRIHDLIVLDIMLPEMDGMSVLSELRRQGVPTPILLLTARNGAEDRVRGLDCGADELSREAVCDAGAAGEDSGAAAPFAGAAGFYLANRALIPIRRSMERQQQFVSDASHELRTPLSVMQAHAELLLRHPAHTIEQDSRHISTVLQEARRMSKLVDGGEIARKLGCSENTMVGQGQIFRVVVTHMSFSMRLHDGSG